MSSYRKSVQGGTSPPFPMNILFRQAHTHMEISFGPCQRIQM